MKIKQTNQNRGKKQEKQSKKKHKKHIQATFFNKAILKTKFFEDF